MCRAVVCCAVQERGNKQLGQNSAAAHLALIVSCVGLSGLWLWQPCETPYLCRLQSMGVGVTYALFASQLIVAHMCKEPFDAPLWAMTLMALAIINKVMRIVDPLRFTLGVDVLLLVGYLHYVVVVINQICAHLGIYCLTIKPKAAAE
jgi:ethanolaminephosphotransferase